MKVYYLSLKKETPNNDYWDYGFLNDFLRGKMWQPKDLPKFTFHEVDSLPKENKAIVVLPARHHADVWASVVFELHKIKHLVLFLMGDEEADFPVDKINHPDAHIWVQNPHPKKHDAYNKLGTGYPPKTTQVKSTFGKTLDLFFSGQITHSRRKEMYEHVSSHAKEKNMLVNPTESFTAGYDQDTYYGYMNKTKIVPCPSGAVIPDSFRLFESLECMAVPIADEVNPSRTITEYWDWLFGETTPFPKVTEWDRVHGLVPEILENWSDLVIKQTAWWIRYKRNFTYKVLEQLHGNA